MTVKKAFLLSFELCLISKYKMCKIQRPSKIKLEISQNDYKKKLFSSLLSCVCFLCLHKGFVSLAPNSSHALTVPQVPTERQQNVGSRKLLGHGLAPDHGTLSDSH